MNKEEQKFDLGATSEMHNGVLYVPLEFVRMASDRRVIWNAETRTVTLALRR